MTATVFFSLLSVPLVSADPIDPEQAADSLIGTLERAQQDSALRNELRGAIERQINELRSQEAATRQSTDAADLTVRFDRDVKPILSENCFACHGPDEGQRKAGLRLDLPEGAVATLKSGNAAVVPGDRTASVLFARITAEDPNDIMPPPESNHSLTPEAIETLGTWIDEGAHYEKHWAFVPPVPPELPEVSNPAWPRNAIDYFILAKLDDLEVRPSAEADRRTLIRRAYLDLIGLPPTVEQVDAFLRDNRPDAYERFVDELLASPHFGERWGRHWLDAARYADSNGYSIDGPRTIWPYRDWVINAFNQDMPFDRFVTEQLAGDLLPDSTRDQKVATGFHRNTMINQEGGIDVEEFRVEAVVDRVNTTGSVLLGLTMGCAECHTHKYDPITQTEYYRFFAFFNNDDEVDLELPTPEQTEKRAEVNAAVAGLQQELDAYLAETLERGDTTWEATLTEAQRAKLSDEERAALGVAAPERSEEHIKLVQEAFKKTDAEYLRLAGELDAAKKEAPTITKTMVLRQRTEPRETTVHVQGDFTRHGDPVTPGTLAVLHPYEGSKPATRLDLAAWLMAPENPLTARVTVNRFWQRLFGRGIVETENDFGTQGTPPTHPELLDWLATEFVEQGWGVKSILRTMVTSATYRQASTARDDLDEIDPTNRWLARQSRVRLDAEIIRDAGLQVSALLDPRIGGPGVHPPQPDGVMSLGQRNRPWDVSEGGDRYRRGMYTYFWRATPYPSLMVFDAPNAMMACTRRTRSNTPLQALTLLNDQAFFEVAKALAKRIAEQNADAREASIDYAFEVSLGREPSTREQQIVAQLMDRQTDEGRDPWLAVARTLLNLDEFITRE
ncbi:MAG: hypothetical protein AMXMBFR82_23340 [Candidatus Hydrogenedentota bacterium]